MNRREAIYGLSMITGMAFVASSGVLNSCSTGFTEYVGSGDVQLLNEIGEVIIPSTANCPGAKFAQTGLYIKAMVNDCMKQEERLSFMKGWHQIQVLGKDKYDKKSISALSDAEKITYLTELDKHTFSSNSKSDADLAIATFQKIKSLTLKGYFTSETGATKALRYDPIPGKFVGVIPYKHGDKAWATTM